MSTKKEVKVVANTKRAKILQDILTKHTKSKYTITEAIEILKQLPQPKFNASIDVSIKLNIDPKKTTQNVRGFAQLPHGIGKTVKIAVFTQGAEFDIAKQTKADIIISSQEEAKEFMENPNVDFCIATPSTMPILAKWGVSKVLGPKGLMPNAKMGTLSSDIKTAVHNLKLGQAMFKNDKAGFLHTTIGRIDFTTEQLVENFKSLIHTVEQAKPAEIKMNIIAKVNVNSTMNPSFLVSHNG